MSFSSQIRFIGATVLVALAITVANAPVAGATAREFTITGGGNGHGIGLSQYGAQGYALKGYDYDWIIRHYFQGVSVSPVTTKNVKVKIHAAATTSNKGYTRTSWRILPGQAGAKLAVNGVVKPTATYTFTAKSGSSSIVLTSPGQSSRTYTGGVTVTSSGGSPPLLQVVEGTGIYTLANSKYRGSLVLTASNGKIKLLNVLPLEEYLYGVVPRESISSWKAEALKAQAVAARSYAYCSTGELFCTTASQAYQGYGAPNSKGVWVGEMKSTNAAVDATAGEVAKYGSTIVQTFFFSASGGHTANIEDSWSYATPQPYYVGVNDPYEGVAGSPYDAWTLKTDGAQLAAKLRASSTVRTELSKHGLPAVPASSSYVVTSVTVEEGVSGYPRWVFFHFSDPAKTVCKLSSYTVKTALGLKSPNFSFSGYPMTRIEGDNRYATAVELSRRTFSANAPAVVIASGEDYPDALTGSALAGAEKGALLLTPKSALISVVEAELKRLNPARVYIMGSSAAISPAVESRIKTVLPAATIERVAGADRYATARKAADKVYDIAQPGKAIVANGQAWPDASAVSALAYAKSYPILLAGPNSLGTAATGYLAAHKPATYVVGGIGVVPESVYDAVNTAATSTGIRLGGDNRFATAVLVAQQVIDHEGFGASEAYITTGMDYPDALTGGMLAGRLRHPLLLTLPNSLPVDLAKFLTANKSLLDRLWIIGGSSSISQDGFDAIDEHMSR